MDVRSAVRLLRNQDPPSYLPMFEDRRVCLISQRRSKLVYYFWNTLFHCICKFDSIFDILIVPSWLVSRWISIWFIPHNSRVYIGLEKFRIPTRLVNWTFTRREAAREEWEHLSHQPLSLPRQRISLSQIELSVQQVSPFLTKLPFELRLMVYEYVLCDKYPHRHILEVRDRIEDSCQWPRDKFYAMPCARSQTLGGEGPTCFGSSWLFRGERGLPAAKTGRERLALLKVSRQVYLESIKTLYSQYSSSYWQRRDSPHNLI